MAPTISFDKFYNVISNENRGADKTQHGINPSTSEALWEVPIATEKDVDEAVTAANAAFKKWSRVPRAEKNKLLEQFANELEKYRDEFTDLLHKENGKPMPFALGEISGGINTVRLHLEWKTPEHVTNETDKVKVVTKYVPVGVVAGILPWNFPFQLAIAKLCPALVTGCTIILKPSPFTPYTALKLVEVAAQVFPPGVVQVLGGDDNLGPVLTKHADINKISFTGSIATGKKVMAAASGTLKRVNLELGGNDAAIVTEDVDIAETAPKVAMAAFINSGQVCAATKRIYVHESIYSEFMEQFTAVVKSFTPGEGLCGPIQNSMQYDKVRAIYDDCVEQKFEFAVGDGKLGAADKSGYFAPPTVVAKPPESSRIVQEEPFGPIVPVLTFHEDADVIERANDTLTGLGATVYCRNEERAWALAESLDTGSVWVNGGLIPDPTALFGGHKQSGIGSEFGPLGLIYYTNPQTIIFTK